MTSLLSKLAADNDTNTTDPPNVFEVETKLEVINLADIFYLRMVGNDSDTR